jgi:hypothetical protein
MADRRSVRWVAIVFAIYMLFQFRYTVTSLVDLTRANERAVDLFTIKSPEGTLTEISDAAKAAGIAAGDRLVSINGQPAKGLAGIARAMGKRHPGDSVQVIVLRNEIPVSTQVTLAPVSHTTQEWVLIAFLNYLTPWFCIILGFTVVFLRPRDLLAWLLLLLMLSFGEARRFP